MLGLGRGLIVFHDMVDRDRRRGHRIESTPGIVRSRRCWNVIKTCVISGNSVLIWLRINGVSRHEEGLWNNPNLLTK